MKPTSETKIVFFGAITCASLCACLPAKADYASTVLGFDPVAYYRLNETVPVPLPDFATNSGTLGTAAQGFYVAPSSPHPSGGALVGSSDTAAYFDGTGARMMVPYNLSFGQNAPFTVEAWVNPAVAPPPSGQQGLAAVLSYGHLADPRSGWLIYQSASGWNLRMYNQNGLNTSLNITGGPAPEAGTWYHLAAVYDGVAAQVFVNGVSTASNTPSGYVPNTDGPFAVGTRSDVAFHFNGTVDEVAVYTNALTAAQLLAHYQNGTNQTPSQPYDQLVLAQHPAAYYRLNEPSYTLPDPSTLPVATNSGSLGSSANGTTQVGCETAAAGPPFSGLGAGNYACQFSGIQGYIDCGATGFDISGPITVMAWVKVNRFDKPWQAILTKGDSSWRLHRSGNSRNLGFGTTGLSNVDETGTRILDDGQWHHVAAVYDGSTKSLYVDSVLDKAEAVTGTLALNTYSVLIGENAQATVRFFNGTIDEVAIFTNALTAAQIQQIFNAGNVPPVIAQQPQAPPGSIIAGSPVSVSVVAAGTPTLSYQWTKEGTNLTGQTTATLAFGNITTNDAGHYAVVVTNTYGSVTSAVVTLNVAFPTAPAALANATGYPVYDPMTQTATLTQVILEFTGPLAAEGGDISHYSIPGLMVSAARFTNLNMTVILTTSPQTQGANYTVTVTGVTDGVGNPLANNTAQFRAWVNSPLNGIRFEDFPGESTANPAFANEAVGALTNNSLFPDQPLFVTNLWAFDSRVVFPDDTHERYGARMRGVFVPPASGNYRFYLRSDDNSQVLLNPNGPEAAGKQLILSEPGCCGDWNKFASPAFPLVAGRGYYLEMLYKEGGGGDYGKVAALLEPSPGITNYPSLGTPNLNIDPASLTGPSIGYPYAPAEVGGPLTVVGPQSATVQANHTTTFTVTASNPGDWPMSYQWRRDGTNIADATGPSYTLVPTVADNNAHFSVQVSKLGSVVVSPDAVLTVLADTDAPAIAEVHGSNALNTIIVSFAELMGTPSASSYSVAGFTTLSAALDSTGTNVVVTLNGPLTPGQNYTLAVQNAQDASGQILASTTVPVRTFVFSRGLLKFDYFPGLSDTDNSLDVTLLSDPRFPNAPTLTGFLTAFDTRTIFTDDSHAGYGALVSGLFVPPANGNYAVYLRSDDSSRFFLNPAGSDPIDVRNTTPLLEELACCHGFAFIGATNGPMVGGQLYAVAAYYKEGNGGDFMQVAAKLETDPANPDFLLPIPSSQVGVLADPIGASVTITQQPPSAVGVYYGAHLNANFDSDDGAFLTVNYGNPSGPWSYNAAAGSWTNFGPSGCGGPFGTGLRTPILTIRSNTPVVLTFAHRYSFEFDASTDWDGAQVRLSVNGGPFATVPGSSFTANGYVGPIEGSILGAIAGTPGWVNEAFLRESAGYTNHAFLTSVANLGSFNPGDHIQLEFLASWDECSEGSEPNWEIDSVQVTGGDAVLSADVLLTVGAESTYRGLANPYMAYFWQRDTGSGFADVAGANSPSYAFYAGLVDSGARYRCIVYSPGASATSDVATVTVTMPLTFTRPTANTIMLSWPLPPPPLNATTFVLEQSSTLLPGSWTTVPPASYQVTADAVSVTVTIQPGPNQFYRLRRT